MPAAAAPERPRSYRLPAEWSELERALRHLDRTHPLSATLGLAKQHGAALAFLEPDYIDEDYRDEYVSFYASVFRQIEERTTRIHFFREPGAERRPRYIGFSVLRPIRTRPVGRTFLEPPAELLPHISCTARAVAHPYGQRLGVRAFPFMEQDARLGVCAHAGMWMVALYHHLVHDSPRRHMSDIIRAAEARLEPWRSIPSAGMSDEQVGVALTQLGFQLRTYAVRQPPRGQTIHQVVCRYLNSRLPVILTTKRHLTVLIGYGRDPNGRLFFIQTDESETPYQRVYDDHDPLGRWDLLFVPLPGRIYLSGETSEPIAQGLFNALLRRPEHAALRRLQDRRRLRLRSYVARAGRYKSRLRERGVPDDAASGHFFISTSNWVWVVELQDRKLARQGRRCVLGEIAIDATSDAFDPNPLLGHLPGRAYHWIDPRQHPTERRIGSYDAYLTGAAIHDPPPRLGVRHAAARLRRLLPAG